MPDFGEDDGPEIDWEPIQSLHISQLDTKDLAAHVDCSQHPFEGKTDLIDSGCTRHISPYQEDFTSFCEIPPKPFCAAKKQSFNAVSTGELTIDLPDSIGPGKLILTEVLYSPKVGYTLISVGRLDDLGFITTFGGGKCIIQAPDGHIIGEVPKSNAGLYRVECGHNFANAVESITLDQLHHRMGHVSPEITHQLVSKGFVTGVKLKDLSGQPTFCESCVYAKATRNVRLGNSTCHRFTSV